MRTLDYIKLDSAAAAKVVESLQQLLARNWGKCQDTANSPPPTYPYNNGNSAQTRRKPRGKEQRV